MVEPPPVLQAVLFAAVMVKAYIHAEGGGARIPQKGYRGGAEQCVKIAEARYGAVGDARHPREHDAVPAADAAAAAAARAAQKKKKKKNFSIFPLPPPPPSSP